MLNKTFDKLRVSIDSFGRVATEQEGEVCWISFRSLDVTSSRAAVILTTFFILGFRKDFSAINVTLSAAGKKGQEVASGHAFGKVSDLELNFEHLIKFGLCVKLVQQTALAASVDDSVARKRLDRENFLLLVRVVVLFDRLQVLFVVF